MFRPKIPLKVTGPTGDHYVAVSLVDTGADETVLPYKVAKDLRVELDSESQDLGSSSGRSLRVWYGVVRLTISRPGVGSYSWESKVGFQKGRRYSVLGFAGCLDRMDVRFDGPNRAVIITTPEASRRPTVEPGE